MYNIPQQARVLDAYKYYNQYGIFCMNIGLSFIYYLIIIIYYKKIIINFNEYKRNKYFFLKIQGYMSYHHLYRFPEY